MITDEERRKYLKKAKKSGFGVLTAIQSLKPFIDFVCDEDSPGKRWIETDLDKQAKLLNKIYESILKDGNAELRDVIELRLIRERLQETYDAINNYNRLINEVKQAQNG